MARILCGNTVTHGVHAHVSAADVRACYDGLPLSLVINPGQFVGMTEADQEDGPLPEVLAVIRPGEHACDWYVPVHTEDGPSERPCGAPAIVTDRGFTCQAGHSHVHAAARRAEGWEYCDATDAHDYAAAMHAGLMPVGMDGGPYDGPTR